VPIRLKAQKPKPFPEEPQTLGEHIKRCRLLRKLTQKQAAKLLGVSPFTVLNWEKNKTIPPVQTIPAILRFLG
jgi:transcriptional regulator with XRE-family HTH domain